MWRRCGAQGELGEVDGRAGCSVLLNRILYEAGLVDVAALQMGDDKRLGSVPHETSFHFLSPGMVQAGVCSFFYNIN